MNRYERPPVGGVEAKVEYGDGEFRVVRPGSFVRCGVTGQPIPLDQLRYWNIERQEPYANVEAKLQRLRETGVLPDAERPEGRS
jgi:hypothetical protein